MIAANVPGYWLFYLSALVIACLPGAGWRYLRAGVLLLTPIVSALCLLTLEAGTEISLSLMDLSLLPFRADRLALLFAYLFHLAALIGFVFALHHRQRWQQVVALLYVGSALGAVFAGDFLTLFIYWEMLALTSVFLIWARATDRARAAGIRYLLMQVLSGVLLLAGSLMIFRERAFPAV